MTRYQEWLTPEKLTLLEGWKREGQTEEEIAKRIGISQSTLRSWRKRFPELNRVLTTDREVTDLQVEQALLRKALGYESVERKVEVSAKGERKEVETTKQVGPDVSAISLWLKRRRPERWGDGAPPGPKPENNLMERLSEGGEGGFDSDAIPELQPPANADTDVVETG